MRRNNILLLIFFTIILTLVLIYQYKVTKKESFEGVAIGEEYQINYSLNKEKNANWTIDVDFSSLNNEEFVIEDTVIIFAKPVSDEIHSVGDELVNHRLEGYVLNNTKLFSESKMKKVLEESYVKIQGVSINGEKNSDKIKFGI